MQKCADSKKKLKHEFFKIPELKFGECPLVAPFSSCSKAGFTLLGAPSLTTAMLTLRPSWGCGEFGR